MTAADSAIAAAREFVDAFNAQDHERIAAVLHYPHVRLAAGRDGAQRFANVESAAKYVAGSRAGEARLAEEGWHHSVLAAVDAVHVAEDKVHLALTMDRCRADGSVYNSFETFWVATREGDHWGIVFRSSNLR